MSVVVAAMRSKVKHRDLGGRSGCGTCLRLVSSCLRAVYMRRIRDGGLTGSGVGAQPHSGPGCQIHISSYGMVAEPLSLTRPPPEALSLTAADLVAIAAADISLDQRRWQLTMELASSAKSPRWPATCSTRDCLLETGFTLRTVEISMCFLACCGGIAHDDRYRLRLKLRSHAQPKPHRATCLRRGGLGLCPVTEAKKLGRVEICTDVLGSAL